LNTISRNNGTIIYFINSNGNIQHFEFKGKEKIIKIYDTDNSLLDANKTITINSSSIEILCYSKNDSLNTEMYILNR